MQNEQNLDSESLKEKIEKEAQLLVERENNQTKQPEVAKITTLGTAEKFKVHDVDDPLAAELGWKNIPIDYLPSQGLFYDSGTQVVIRAATVAEIRHWSTIDENDLIGVDDMLNFIIEKCCKIKIPGRAASFKDLKEIDRFYLIFAIRDYTFKNGENKLYVNATDSDGVTDKIEVTKDVIDYFNPDERMMKYFSHEEHCFKLEMKNGEKFNMYFPGLGVMAFIKNYIKTKQQQGQNFDKAFIKYAPFLFNDWRSLTQAAYDKAVQDSYSWSVTRISALDKLVEILSASVNPQVKYVSPSGAEVTAPLNFQGGIKSIFLISDIFGELV
jgi:hypothetical protein